MAPQVNATHRCLHEQLVVGSDRRVKHTCGARVALQAAAHCGGAHPPAAASPPLVQMQAPTARPLTGLLQAPWHTGRAMSFIIE